MKLAKLFKSAAVTGGALLVAKGLDNRLETTHYTIASDKIPAEFDGFRIVQISDLHASAVPGLIAEVKNESPDIIVLTGDLVHDRGSFEPGTMLARKLALVSDVYFVTGNHDLKRADYVKFQEALDKTSTVTLHNESVTIEKNGKEITLSGIEDPFSETGTNVTESILNSVNEIKKTDNYHIALFHRANHMDLLCNKGFDLIISGHMHGGQVRLPNGRGVCSPRSSWGSGSPMLFPKYFAGHYTKDGTDMIVSRGIGNPMIIPRLFNRPELTVIILKSENK
ncbi:MAG: metallophosphoesterase [Clostridia bacterium]|nr:metallophosphoesterase [Clostridia bacterium]